MIHYFTSRSLIKAFLLLAVFSSSIASAQFSAPTVPATGAVFSGVASTSMTINWTNGNGAYRIVTMRLASNPFVQPANGSTNLLASSKFGAGSNIGGNNYVVYDGTSNFVTVSGLTAGTYYSIAVIEYNSGTIFSTTNYYYCTGNASGNKYTLATAPTIPSSSIVVGKVTGTTAELSWTPGNGTYHLVSMRTYGSTPEPYPTNGTLYKGSSIYGKGYPLGGSYIVYSGTGSGLTVSGLTPGYPYEFHVYEYNGTTSTYNYLTKFSAGTFTTANNLPTIDQPKNVSVCIGERTDDINLMGISAGGESQTLSLSVSSSNTVLIPTPKVVYTSPDSTAVLTYYHTKGMTGTSTITVSVQESLPTQTPTTKVTFDITIKPLPSAAGTITGTAVVCQGEKLVAYSVSPISNTSNYNWVLPVGAKISSGANTNAVTVNYATTSASGNMSVYGKNLCGIGSYSPAFTVTVNPLPAAAGAISGTATVCQGQKNVAYSIADIIDATGYVWQLPSGATIVSGQNTSSILVNYADTAKSGSITVYGTNACGGGTPSASFPITVNPIPGAAGIIAGPQAICEKQTSVVYSVPVIENATSYLWTLPSGVTVSGGEGTNSITVNIAVGASSGNITVKGVNDCGEGIISAALPVTINALPGAAGTVAGTNLLCQMANGLVYSVASISNATSYVWSLPVGAHVASGDSTQSITVSYSDSALSGSITVKGLNGCGTGTTSSALAVQVDALPTKADAGADQTICSSIATLNASAPLVGTGLWTKISGSCSINEIDNPNTNAGGIATPATVKLKWTISNGVCASSADTVVITSQVCPLAADFTASASVKCIDNSSITFTDYSVGATSYSWDFGADATPATANTVGPHTVTFGSAGPKTIKLTVGGIGGTTNTNTKSNFITINPLPGAAGSISGSQTVCAGATAVNYSVSPIANATTYSWVLSSGAVINTGAGNSAITVNYDNTASSGSMVVYGTNSCGNGPSSNLSVTVNPLPAAAGTVSGQSSVCQKEKGVVFKVPAIANATGYNWTLPSGMIVAGNNTDSIVVDFFANASSGNVKVRGTNTCGLGVTSNAFTLSVNPLPEDAGIITGTATVCASQNGVTYAVPAILNASNYIWTLPAGATIASGDSTKTITVNFASNATSGNIRVKGLNACGAGTLSVIFPVTVNPLPAAATAVLGTSSVCQGTTGVAYSLSAIDNATMHKWTLPAGATVASGENTNVISVDFALNAASGNIVVKGVNACGAGDSIIYPLTVKALPDSAKSISGGLVVCQGQAGVNYSVPVVNHASYYVWTFPSGVGIVTGDSTNAVTASFAVSSASGNVTVKGKNNCGVGAAAEQLITVNPLPDAAGSLSGPGMLSQCVGAKGVQYAVAKINNANSYVWTMPSGATILLQDEDSVLVKFHSEGNRAIKVHGLNTCGTGASSSFPVSIVAMSSVPLCYVSVDTLSASTMVAWEKPASAEIDSFKVYRETTGGYTEIAKIPYGAFSMVVDTSADPNKTFYSYKLSAIDTCGNESVLSGHHSTIYLQANLGLGNVVNLNWTKYEGIDVKYYRILRDDASTGNFHVIDSLPASNSLYTDMNAGSYPNSRYAIEVMWAGNCGPTNKMLASINTTRSNIKNTTKMITSLPTLNKEDAIQIFPNPASGSINIDMVRSENNVSINIYNTFGQLVLTDSFEKGETIKSIDINHFARGVYMVRISGTRTVYKKVVVE